ncbi:coiled-coil domain-containing protein [Acrasis kona]|uniref:Dynein regulatory complex protein 12 n=1 Tax=Acrasis kona TaxID=1008807 RepID=A0AAW2Z995_9EUKA
MPPKTAPAKSKKSGKNEKSEADIILGLQEELQQAKLRIESLERFMMLRTEQTQRAKSDKEEMRERLKQLDEDFEKEKMERFHIASDMIRQYKTMERTLLDKIDDAENKNNLLNDRLALSKIALEETKKEKDQIIEMKNKEIEEQKQKKEDMVIEFTEMLKETLTKMGNTITESSKEEDNTSISLLNDDKIKEIIGADTLSMRLGINTEKKKQTT